MRIIWRNGSEYGQNAHRTEMCTFHFLTKKTLKYVMSCLRHQGNRCAKMHYGPHVT